MAVFQLVLCLLLGGVGLALLAPKLGVPWPALLALAGAALAFVPGMPEIALEPRLALALFVAPVLLDAAFDASPRDLRRNWAPVANLALVTVALTVAAVAIGARALMPDMGWPAAIALGAIVAPPDAAAATSVLRQLHLPHRLLVILEGESLLNDASSLLIYRVAVGAAAAGVTAWSAPLAVLAALGGLALGVAMARLYFVLVARLPFGAPSVLLQFLGTFGVWLLADEIGASAVLTMVAYGVTIARVAPGRSSGRSRRSSYAVWEVVVFVLNVLAFILVGLQLRGIATRLDGDVGHSLAFAACVLALVVAVRMAWVMSYVTAIRWKNRRFGVRAPAPMMLPTTHGGVLVSWCGMRGIVTLAAALALPEAFPQRDLIVFTAFCVVLGTLVLQGMTLRPLLARLDLPADTSVEDETALARAEAARAGLQALHPDRASEAGRLLMDKYQARLNPDIARQIDLAGMTALRRRALAAERTRLVALRDEGRIGDDAFHVVEEELDWAQAALEGGANPPAAPPTPAA